jgi:hypothetical protein
MTGGVDAIECLRDITLADYWPSGIGLLDCSSNLQNLVRFHAERTFYGSQGFRDRLTASATAIAQAPIPY